EGVSGAGRIEDCFERISGNRKVCVPGKHRRAVLAALYNQSLWSPRKNFSRRLDQLRLISQLTRFGVIDDHKINDFDRLLQGIAGSINPMIHRIKSHQFGIRKLFAHTSLQIRLNIAKKYQSRFSRSVRKLRLKAGKY